MKKTILVITGMMLAVSAMAQGFLYFGNNTAGIFRNPIYDVNPANPTVAQVGQSSIGFPVGSTVYGGPLVQGTNYIMALYAGVGGISDPSLLTFVTSATFRTATGNVLPAGLIQSFGIQIPGVPPGAVATFEVRVWDMRTGLSFDTAQISGRSGLVQSYHLGGLGPSGPVLSPDSNGWSSFSLSIVPEPSNLALVCLGVAGLLIIRREKKDRSFSFFVSLRHKRRSRSRTRPT